MTVTATNVHLKTRRALANVIGIYSNYTQYVNARDTIAQLDIPYAKCIAIVEFACSIDAISWAEHSECIQTVRDIHEVQGSLRKCARLPASERAKHLAHLQSHSVAATAARVASLKSILRSA